MTTNARIGLATHQATVERVESLEKSLNEANRWDADRRLLESLTRNLREAKRKLTAAEHSNEKLNKHLDELKRRERPACQHLDELKKVKEWLSRARATITAQGQKIKEVREHSNAELEDVKKKLFASKNNVKMLSKDLDRVIAARAALKALNADNKLLLDLQKRLIEKQDKSIDELKNLSGHFHQDISNYKAAIKNYRADIDRLLLKNGNYRVEIDRLVDLLSKTSLIDWRNHVIKTQEIRIKKQCDVICELRQSIRDRSRVSTGQEIRIKELGETIHNLEQQAVDAEMLAVNPLDGATEKIEGQNEFIHKLQRESDTMYREKENLLTRLSSKDRRIKKLEAILVRFGFVYNEEKN